MLTTSLSITHCCAPSMTSAAMESACWLHGPLCAEESMMGGDNEDDSQSDDITWEITHLEFTDRQQRTVLVKNKRIWKEDSVT